MVDSNVLSPIDDGELTSIPTDGLSIMCYHLPASIMKGGKAIEGGVDINSADFQFCHELYPLSSVAPRRSADLPIKKVISTRQLQELEAQFVLVEIHLLFNHTDGAFMSVQCLVR